MEKRYFRCNCGTYIHPATRKPCEPHTDNPIILTIGILVCDACAGTAYDVVKNTLPGERVGDTRRRIGRLRG